MAGKVNMRAEEYGFLAEGMKNVHEKQLSAMHTAMIRIQTLLDDGFQADLISAKLKQMLADMEQELLPALEDKFRRTEENVDQMIQEIQNADAVR